MLNYILKRLLGLLPTLLIVAGLVFMFVHLLPGDPARLAAGPEADAETVQIIRKDLGLDLPMHEQFWRFISNAAQGDFGHSLRSKRPVSTEIAERFMPTFWLTVAAMGWSASTGEADWALRPLLGSESAPPKSFNTAYYKNAEVDADISKALLTTDNAEKTKLYADAQQRIWKDAPWVFLVTEQLVSARTKNLSGFYMMPDASFNFDEIELK